MAKDREQSTENESQILLDQVNGLCPICLGELTYKKGKRYYKDYEIAHIYPLNPKPDELILLGKEIRLSADVNDLANLIPLCTKCHTRFDKPRTVEEYRKLCDIKRKLEGDQNRKRNWYRFNIQEEIDLILEELSQGGLTKTFSELSYDPRAVDQKVNETLSPLTKKNVLANVSEYYSAIKIKMKSIDALSSNFSMLLASEIKIYYLELSKKETSQQVIYDSLCDWIFAKSSKQSLEACRIIVSFFIQNCEVFE